MKFTIDECVFCGWCGDKAVIAKGRDVRLLRYFYDISAKLSSKQHCEISIICSLDSDGDIWIVSIEE